MKKVLMAVLLVGQIVQADTINNSESSSTKSAAHKQVKPKQPQVRNPRNNVVVKKEEIIQPVTKTDTENKPKELQKDNKTQVINIYYPQNMNKEETKMEKVNPDPIDNIEQPNDKDPKEKDKDTKKIKEPITIKKTKYTKLNSTNALIVAAMLAPAFIGYSVYSHCMFDPSLFTHIHKSNNTTDNIFERFNYLFNSKSSSSYTTTTVNKIDSTLDSGRVFTGSLALCAGIAGSLGVYKKLAPHLEEEVETTEFEEIS